MRWPVILQGGGIYFYSLTSGRVLWYNRARLFFGRRIMNITGENIQKMSECFGGIKEPRRTA
jgi:hypothetical protein